MNTEFIVHPQKAVDYRMTDFNCEKKRKVFLDCIILLTTFDSTMKNII